MLESMLALLFKGIFGMIQGWFSAEKKDARKREIETLKQSIKTQKEAKKLEKAIEKAQANVPKPITTDSNILGSDLWNTGK